MGSFQSDEMRWRTAVEQGHLGVWDLDPSLDLVHYSPRWKEYMGFADAGVADSTSFWRCRVHPEDLAAMLKALRSHIDGFRPSYEATFRLRSNGSGYRRILSRGLAVERDAHGNALRMVGTMVDLTERPASPSRDLLMPAERPSAVAEGSPPFHQLLGGSSADGLLGKVSDLLDVSLRQAMLRA